MVPSMLSPEVATVKFTCTMVISMHNSVSNLRLAEL